MKPQFFRDQKPAARLRLAASLSSLLLFLPLACPLRAPAATFTAPITINEGDATYDGLDNVVDGTTVTINGPHGFNSLLLTAKYTGRPIRRSPMPP